MNTYFSVNTLKTVGEHLPEKIAVSAGVTGIASALGILSRSFTRDLCDYGVFDWGKI